MEENRQKKGKKCGYRLGLGYRYRVQHGCWRVRKKYVGIKLVIDPRRVGGGGVDIRVCVFHRIFRIFRFFLSAENRVSDYSTRPPRTRRTEIRNRPHSLCRRRRPATSGRPVDDAEGRDERSRSRSRYRRRGAMRRPRCSVPRAHYNNNNNNTAAAAAFRAVTSKRAGEITTRVRRERRDGKTPAAV